jgi:hypothetical protein
LDKAASCYSNGSRRFDQHAVARRVGIIKDHIISLELGSIHDNPILAAIANNNGWLRRSTRVTVFLKQAIQKGHGQ